MTYRHREMIKMKEPARWQRHLDKVPAEAEEALPWGKFPSYVRFLAPPLGEFFRVYSH